MAIKWSHPSSPPRYCLEVQFPFSRYILSGEKTIETRLYPLPSELHGETVLLVESVTGEDGKSSLPDCVGRNHRGLLALGHITFSQCIKYNSYNQWDADRERHCVSVGSFYDFPSNSITSHDNPDRFGWVISSVSSSETDRDPDSHGSEAIAISSLASCPSLVTGMFPGNPPMNRWHRSIFKIATED